MFELPLKHPIPETMGHLGIQKYLQKQIMNEAKTAQQYAKTKSL
jgi:hypothetical protein